MLRLVDRSAVLVGSAFYTGYFPVASGTVGSLVGVAVFLLAGGRGWLLYMTVLLLVIVAGLWSAARCERIYNEKDSSRIVIDEVAGYLVSMAFLPVSWPWMAAGFFLFRFFDIVKLPPADWADRNLKGGAGIMLDDLVAGLYTCLILNLALRLL